MSEKVIARTVSMYSQEWDIVDRVDRLYGYRSTSAALRFIVNNFQSPTSPPCSDDTGQGSQEEHDDQA